MHLSIVLYVYLIYISKSKYLILINIYIIFIVKYIFIIYWYRFIIIGSNLSLYRNNLYEIVSEKSKHFNIAIFFVTPILTSVLSNIFY